MLTTAVIGLELAASLGFATGKDRGDCGRDGGADTGGIDGDVVRSELC